jgi:hypothetical protein
MLMSVLLTSCKFAGEPDECIIRWANARDERKRMEMKKSIRSSLACCAHVGGVGCEECNGMGSVYENGLKVRCRAGGRRKVLFVKISQVTKWFLSLTRLNQLQNCLVQ